VQNWLSLAALAGFVFIIYFNFDKFRDPETILKVTEKLKNVSGLWWKLTIILVLVFINYFIEAIKWRQLVSGLENISIMVSMKSVLIGLLFALFTPARLGEIGGRIIVLNKPNRWQGVASLLAGSLSQNLAIIIAGCGAMIYFLYQPVQLSGILTSSISIGTTLLLILGLVIYFNMQWFFSAMKKRIRAGKIATFIHQFDIVANYSRLDLMYILILSLLRILVWTALYLLLFQLIFDVSVNLDFLMAVFLIFLFQTAIPLPLVTGFLARGGVAIIVWQYFGVSEWVALLTTFSLYFINLLLPALVGLFVLMLNKDETKENE
jgi:hypothetical protein